MIDRCGLTMLAVMMPERIGPCHMIGTTMNGAAAERARCPMDSEIGGRNTLDRNVITGSFETAKKHATSKAREYLRREENK